MIDLSSYRALLGRGPGQSDFGRLILAYGLARFPVGINALALAMCAQAAYGSAAVAGWVTAAYLTAMGIQNPILGRWIDQRGPQGVLPLIVPLHVLALLLYVLGLHMKLGVGALIAASALAGITMPPVPAIFRAVLRRSDLPQPQRHAAFALDAVLVELCFVAGPLIAALFAAFGHTWAALGVSAVMGGVGCWLFVAAGGLMRWGQPLERLNASWFGPLWLKPVRAVLFAMGMFGIGIGFLEMGLTAAAAAMGKPPAVGWAFAAISLTSALAGVWHGSRHIQASLPHQFAVSLLWLALTCLALAFAQGVLSLVLICFLMGLAFAPSFTASHSQLAAVAPAAQSTEAFTWLSTVLMIGIGAGWAVCGTVAQRFGWRAALAAGAACMLTACFLGLRMRPAPSAENHD